MYYYIFDIKRFRKKGQIDLIKNQLTSLGISGEYAYIAPNQSAEVLAENALNRGYSTIIAAGSDDLINSVANVLVGRREVLGILPLSASDELTNLIGCKDWQSAVEVLRFRRIKEMNLGKIAGNKHFITSLYLDINSPVEVTVEFKDFILQAWAKNLIISNYHPEILKKFADNLDVAMESIRQKPTGIFKKISNIIKPSEQNLSDNISFVRAKSLRVFTKTAIPLVAGDRIIARTPQLIESSEDKIRLIVAKNS